MDTSVIGGCLDINFAPWSKGLMKDFRLGNYKPVISELVAAEVDDAPNLIKQQYFELLELEPEYLYITEEALQLADIYQLRKILTPNFYADGLHIALATISEVDVLVSWNFRHIVHFNKIRLFNSANLEMGYKAIEIFSPREVTNYEEE